MLLPFKVTAQYDKKLSEHISSLNTSVDIRMFGSWDVSDDKKRQAFSFFNYIYCPRYIYCVSRYRACLTISEIAVESKLGRVWVPCKWPLLHTQKHTRWPTQMKTSLPDANYIEKYDI